MIELILLNAPAGVGKDTLADIIVERDVCKDKVLFKEPLFDIVKDSLTSKDYDVFISNYNDRKFKESAHDFLGGKTVREYMIWLSEDVIKPAYGPDAFGVRLAQSLNNRRYGRYVCSDGGFVDEVKPILDAGIKVTLIRLHRDGYTFEGDSRNYLYNVCANEVDIDVIDGDISGTVDRVINAINNLT